MEKCTIYYSKSKTLISIVLTIVGILIGIFIAVTDSVFWGLLTCLGSLFAFWSYTKQLKRKTLIEFSNKGVFVGNEFIDWKFIKKISLQNNNFEDKDMELLVEYTDSESIKEYKMDQKEIENDNYFFNQKEFDDTQNLMKKTDAELGFKNTYFEYFDNEEEANKVFNKNTEKKLNHEIKPEAEIYYNYKTIDLEYADKSEEEIKKIFSIFENRVNKKLP